MDATRQKLAHCFSLAFPQLEPSQYATANADNVPGWDSMAQLTLLSLVGEEFGIEVDFEEFEGATSFEAIADRLNEICSRA